MSYEQIVTSEGGGQVLAKAKSEPNELNTKVTSKSEAKRRQINPNFFQFMFMTWLEPLFHLGSKKPLEEDDLLQLHPSDQSRSGVVLAGLLFLAQLIGTIARVTAQQMVRDVALGLRTMLTGAVYDKSLRINGPSAQNFSQGQILNLVNVDTDQITFCLLNTDVIGIPVQVIVSIYLLHLYLGNAIWAGVGAMVGVTIIQISFIFILGNFERAVLAASDKRLKLIRELLYAIKVIKYRAWEELFEKKVDALRNEQLSYLRKNNLALIVFICLGQITPIVMPIASFVVYQKLSGSLDPIVVFPALTLFTSLFIPLIDLPQIVPSLINLSVSWKRISAFLTTAEFEPINFEKAQERASSPPKKSPLFSRKEIKKFEDPAPVIQPFLRDLNVDVKRGSLTAVVGAVGSGKSSLLSAILGEMEKDTGSVAISGKIAFCAQQPWTLSDTVRGNICFFKEYDEAKMIIALDVCALRRDLEDFPAGEMTEIGEKGVNLSGGQKARVALARAVYAGEGEGEVADIYLMDDPISALDAQVGMQVFQDCILEHLVRRKKKTVVLVTHQLQLLRFCDRVLVMDHGRLVEDGTLDQLMESTRPDGTPDHLAEMMKNYTGEHRRSGRKDEEKGEKAEDSDIELTGASSGEETEQKGDAKPSGALIEAEEREIGAVRLPIYGAFIKAGGGWAMFGAAVFVALLTQAASVGSNIWLSYWVGGLTSFDANTNLVIYSSLGVIQAVFLLLLNGVMVFMCLTAATYFHKAALSRLLSSPMSFFDSNPIGRIMNRFSKDVMSLDKRLMFVLYLFVLGASGFLGSLVAICFASPIVLAVVGPVAVVYWYLMNYYRNTLREVKRLESITRSTLNAHISETLVGVMSVRAYGAEARFVEKERSLMDRSSEPIYIRWSAQGWISIRIASLASLITLVLCLIGIYSGGTETVFIGLGLSYAVGVNEQIALLLQSLAALESEMNAVERMVHYAENLPQERPRRLESDPKPAEWPKQGAISFLNLELRYESRPETAVIKDFSADIQPGERVALVGRTGSGKSSLMTALFRIVESSGGSVIIDWRDISELGLHSLRSRIQIIPQEPVLFEGTIRSNLDVEDEFVDDDLWSGLEQVGLKEYVLQQEKKLDAPVTEGGESLSVGQRQLMCLARAILKKPQILVMDEATASVDTKADKLIQESIETNFGETTVISIAHRLNTVAGFDRVMVLDGGNLVEFDTPHNLLQNDISFFTNLLEATGKENARVLRKVAADKNMLDQNKSKSAVV
ncbi:P-loop containing nucleoside triphosphate hydrolase protein [Cladochytrium replicatum]|nr:P-loop containing nucleoside triphosphate hydrolase protein [Cladochytrium replicatum]